MQSKGDVGVEHAVGPQIVAAGKVAGAIAGVRHASDQAKEDMVVERVVGREVDLVGEAAALGTEACRIVEPEVVVEQVELQVLGGADGDADGARVQILVPIPCRPLVALPGPSWPASSLPGM